MFVSEQRAFSEDAALVDVEDQWAELKGRVKEFLDGTAIPSSPVLERRVLADISIRPQLLATVDVRPASSRDLNEGIRIEIRAIRFTAAFLNFILAYELTPGTRLGRSLPTSVSELSCLAVTFTAVPLLYASMERSPNC